MGQPATSTAKPSALGAVTLVVTLAVGAACGADTDPTSAPSAGHRSAGAAAQLTPPPTDSPPATLASGTVPSAAEPSTSVPPTTDLPTTVPPTTVPPTTVPGPALADGAAAGDTEPDLTPVTDNVDLVNPDGAGELVTDDPSFDVEPLRPFVVDAADVVAAPAVDDTGAEQPTGWAAFDLYLDDALIRNGNTAASVAVAIGGEVVHAEAFGIRAPFISTEGAEPQDRFRIASISKPITAITLLRLVEQGVVGLDEPVGQIVADHIGVTPSIGARAITVRRLLSHTTGFGKYDTEFFRKGSQDCDDAARTGMRRGVSGGGYRYSNMNFCVAGVLIEALTAKSYEAAAYEQLLTPLGLSGLRLANTFDPGPNEILHPSSEGRNYMETLGAAGSWIATPSDLVTIMDSLDFSTPGFKPLAPETVQLMKTPAGAQFGQRGYGLGLISYGPNRYGHTGTIESTHAMAMNRGDGVTWSITVSGPYPNDTPRLESIINSAFEAAGFIAG